MTAALRSRCGTTTSLKAGRKDCRRIPPGRFIQCDGEARHRHLNAGGLACSLSTSRRAGVLYVITAVRDCLQDISIASLPACVSDKAYGLPCSIPFRRKNSQSHLVKLDVLVLKRKPSEFEVHGLARSAPGSEELHHNQDILVVLQSAEVVRVCADPLLDPVVHIRARIQTTRTGHGRHVRAEFEPGPERTLGELASFRFTLSIALDAHVPGRT